MRKSNLGPAFAALLLASVAPHALPSGAAAQHAVSLTAQSPRSVTAIRFRFKADGPVRGGFGLAGQRLLFGTEVGTAYALDALSGRVRWTRNLGSPVNSTPAVDGSRAYFTTWDNVLHALNAVTGRELWRRDLGRTLGPNDYWEYYISSPVLAGGKLYVGSGSGRLLALDPGTGRTSWSFDAGSRVRTTPALTSKTVLIGTMAGHVIAVDRVSGRQLWKFATVGAAQDFSFKNNDTRSVVTQPIVVGDIVIAGGRDGNIYGIDLATGRERWRETHDGGSWILGLASDGKRFYSGSGSALIMQAADPATGKEIWRVPTGNAMFGGVALAGDVLVSSGSQQGSLFAFDRGTGAQLWRIRLPEMSFASPLVAPGAIFTGADDGTVVALETSAAPAPKLERIVYSFTNAPPASYFWFNQGVAAAIGSGFTTSGYKHVGSDELAKVLGSGRDGGARKVVVLADARLPADVDAAAFRHYLDDGGIAVMLGPNPAAYKFDKDGAPAGEDFELIASALGIAAPTFERDNGYNMSRYSEAARRLGLTGVFVSNRWVRPDQVTTVLATDRTGMATAWIKTYRNRGQLIMLPLPRYRVGNTAAMVDAIELIASAQ